MAKGKFKCKKCDRSFKMALHLARHASAAHGSGKKKAAAKKKRVMKKLGRPKAKKVGRPKKRRTKKLGRPKGIVGRLKLRDMSLDQLAQVIDAARDEARRRLAELQASMG